MFVDCQVQASPLSEEVTDEGANEGADRCNDGYPQRARTRMFHGTPRGRICEIVKYTGWPYHLSYNPEGLWAN